MSNHDKCPICKKNEMEYFIYENLSEVHCPRCGDYYIHRDIIMDIKEMTFTSREVANISGYIYENKDFIINKDNLYMLKKIQSPSFHEKSDKLLIGLEKMTEYAGQYLEKDDDWLWVRISWCLDDKELNEILSFLESSNRIHRDSKSGTHRYKISPMGWLYLETIKKKNPESQQCFVAMWFDDEMNEIYENYIKKGIINAGYKPVRIDQKPFNDKIDDQILAEIRKSKFIIADFTGHRGGVYFEAGFALGLNLEVIFICRKDDLKKLHFDVRQYNFILWEKDSLNKLRDSIQYRIERIFGKGNYNPN